jgi:hypothetical protein
VGAQIWSFFGQICHPSSRRSRKGNKLSILPLGHSILLFLERLQSSWGSLAILKPMVQTNYKSKLQCKSYTRASSIFFRFFGNILNFCLVTCEASILWGKYLVRQVSCGSSRESKGKRNFGGL